MQIDDRLTLEARVFGKYLIGEEINDRAIGLYAEAHRHKTFDLDEQDRLLLDLVLSQPFWAGYVDGGLAILKKRSNLRKKIYYLLAILEAMPEYADHFMAKQTSPLTALFRLAWFGIRGVVRASVGCLLCLSLRGGHAR